MAKGDRAWSVAPPRGREAAAQRLQARIEELRGKVSDIQHLRRDVRRQHRDCQTRADNRLSLWQKLGAICPSADDFRAEDVSKQRAWQAQLQHEFEQKAAALRQECEDRRVEVTRLQREKNWLLADVDDFRQNLARCHDRRAAMRREVAQYLSAFPSGAASAPGAQPFIRDCKRLLAEL